MKTTEKGPVGTRRWELGSDLSLQLDGERLPVSTQAIVSGLRMYQVRSGKRQMRTVECREIPEDLARTILACEARCQFIVEAA